MKQKIKFNLANVALMLFAVFFSSVTMAQVIVQVPVTCNVVVAGVGGTTGFGGFVGDGGIVTMTDPFAGAVFTYFPGCCAGPTPAFWKLKGDLSITQAATPPSPALQTGGALVGLSIMSYNEHLILPYETDGGGINNARNIGMVFVGYNLTGPCSFINLTIAFTVYKVYSGTPLMTGPNYIAPVIAPTCIEAGTTYAVSQAPNGVANLTDAIGLDEDWWTCYDHLGTTPIPLITDYFSADGSAWTFTTPLTLTGYAQPFQLQVCDGRANPWDGDVILYPGHTTCAEKDIYVSPTMPTFLFPGVPTCIPTGITSWSFTWNTIPGLTYTWTTSNGVWALATTTGVGTETLNITDMDDNPSLLTLTITGPCPPVVFTFQVNRTFTLGVTTISGPTCVTAGAGFPYTITSGADVLGNCTVWHLPPGWSYNPLNGDASMVKILVPPGTPCGPYPIIAEECFCPGPINLIVYVAPDPPGPISGPTCVDIAPPLPSENYIAVSPSACPVTYNWTFPPGWTNVSGPNSSSTFEQVGGCGPGPVTISVVAVGPGGCTSTASSLNVNFNPINPIAITLGCYSDVPGTMTLDVLPSMCGFDGTWTLTTVPGGFFTGYSTNPLTGEITAGTTGLPSQPQICVTHNSIACGSGPTFCSPPQKIGQWAWVGQYCNSSVSGSDIYVVYGAPSGSTFDFYMAGTGLLQSGPSNTLVCSASYPPTGVITVVVTNGTCVNHLGPITPCTHGFRETDSTTSSGTGGAKSPGLFMQVYSDEVKVNPNPNPGTFKVELPKFKSSAYGKLIAADGKEVGNYTFKDGENYVSNDGLAPGTYLLILFLDDNVSSYKIEILKH